MSLITLVCLWGLILAAGLLIFHNYILGNECMVFGDVGSDTKQQYIMWYNGIANQLRHGGLSSWDFHDGFGINTYYLNLFEPFLWLVYLTGALLGPERIARVMVYMHILKILCAGTTCYFFLSQYRVGEKAKLAASFMYAFNGYLMVWGQHYALGTVIVWMPLLLLFAEKAIKKRSALFGLALFTAITVVSGYYQGYMALLAVGLFIVLRVLLYEEQPWKERLKLFLCEGFTMVFGVVMGACYLLPAIYILQGTSRLKSSTSLIGRIVESLRPWGKSYYKTIVYRLFGSNLQGAGNDSLADGNYYEAACLFFSTLFIILLVQFLIHMIMGKERTIRQKIAQILGVLGIVFCVGIQAGSLIFNGFAYAFSRQTFVFMPFFALVSALALERIFEEQKISKIGLLISTLLIVAVYGRAYQIRENVDYRSNALMLLLTGIGMGIVLLLYTGSRFRHESLMMILFALLFVNIVSDTQLCYRYRGTVKKNDDGYFRVTYRSEVTEALAWIEEQDGAFYRVEKDFRNAGYYLESLAQHYMGVSTYNAMQNTNILRFVNQMWPQLWTGYDGSHFDYKNAITDTEMSTLVGVKYLLSHSENLALEGFTLIHSIGDVYIYRNENCENIGKFFTRTISEELYRKKKKSIETWDFVSQVLVTDTETDFELTAEDLTAYSEIPMEDLIRFDEMDPAQLSALKQEEERATEQEEVTPADQEETFLTDGTITEKGLDELVLPMDQKKLDTVKNVIMEFTLASDRQTEIYIYTDDVQVTDMNCYDTVDFRFYIPSGTKKVTIRPLYAQAHLTLSKIRFYKDNTTLSFSDEGEISIESPKKDSHVTGAVNAKSDGIVMLAIPFQNGWKLWLDGNETEMIKGDFGFISFPVKAGLHEFRLQFSAPGAKLGTTLTLVCLGIWIAALVAYVLVSTLRTRKEKKV